jgi:hypothetical protein
MARFNLEDYATVAERLNLLYEKHPDARIITENMSTAADREKGIWIVKSTLYLTDADQERGLPKATGHAFEIDGTSGANATSALENAETSSIGRCLSVANWNGNRKQDSLASREEMAKVERVMSQREAEYRQRATATEDLEELRKVFAEARSAHIGKETLDWIEAKARGLAKPEATK